MGALACVGRRAKRVEVNPQAIGAIACVGWREERNSNSIHAHIYINSSIDAEADHAAT